MHLKHLTPNVYSIYREIDNKSIDLDPEFQRGDVWNIKKQQMLIDTILRDWQIPPIFFIRNKLTHIKEVLDGHQRLRAIQNFMHDRFPVNGAVEPFDEDIYELDGLFFEQLPRPIRDRFENFSLQTYEVLDYKGSEPFELFYRLNQNSVLTSAERRNTLFGRARDQVKEIVADMDVMGFSSGTIGFNNSRQNYDDVIARSLMALERRDLGRKITDIDITTKFRDESGFNVVVFESVKRALSYIGQSVNENPIRLNKPALTSLIIFVSTCDFESIVDLSRLMSAYKKFLASYKRYGVSADFPINIISNEYLNRISTSVNDPKAMMFRQFFFCWLADSENISVLSKRYNDMFMETFNHIQSEGHNVMQEVIGDVLKNYGWANL